MTHLLDYLADRVLLATARWARRCRRRNLEIERDFHGHENCTEILCESRPDLVREIHLTYLRGRLRRGQTNSFGGSPITLGEFGIADKAFDLNRRAAELAREAIAEFAHDGRTRFVLRLGRPGHAAAVARTYRLSGSGRRAGGAMRRARRRRGRRVPDRDLPGPAADQGCGQRRQARARARPARTSRSSSRSRSRRPAPCWSAPTSPPRRRSSMRSTCR